jgi:hypothetical protein
MEEKNGIDLQAQLAAIGRHFDLPGPVVHAEPYGNGHINNTYLARCSGGQDGPAFIFQRINHFVFKQPQHVMENISRVTHHIREKLESYGVQDIDRRVLRLVPRIDGSGESFTDDEGYLWRGYHFIQNTHSFDIIANEEQAFEVARCFGEFQQHLTDLPLQGMHETIPGFHDTRLRFTAFQRAVEQDSSGRAAQVKPEIEFILKREKYVDRLLDLHRQGYIPARVIHNDTKMNNLLFDAKTGEGLCVTDLDTTMPGLALYDFGDMVRTVTVDAAEDERDLSQVVFNPAMFEALVQGYLTAVDGILTRVEVGELVFSGKLITLETGIRFLTDYLQGDIYFKTHRPDHNLDRCRTQLKLVAGIEEEEDNLQAIIEPYL